MGNIRNSLQRFLSFRVILVMIVVLLSVPHCSSKLMDFHIQSMLCECIFQIFFSGSMNLHTLINDSIFFSMSQNHKKMFFCEFFIFKNYTDTLWLYWSELLLALASILFRRGWKFSWLVKIANICSFYSFYTSSHQVTTPLITFMLYWEWYFPKKKGCFCWTACKSLQDTP